MDSKMSKTLIFHSLFFVIGMLLFACVVYQYVNLKKFDGKVKTEVLDLHAIKFNTYIRKFGKSYTKHEHGRRFQNFKESLKEINRLNNERGSALYGLTKYSDMSKDEFQKTMLMSSVFESQCEHRQDKNCLAGRVIKRRNRVDGPLPEKFDWREKKVVGPVLDQGGCRSCWAISVVGIMESMVVIENRGNFRRLSAQELTDCSNYTQQCKGGNVAFAMKYLCRYQVPITYESKYPLTLVDEPCLFSPMSGVKVLSYDVECDVPAHEIIERLYRDGPVTAAVNVENWHHYLGGIIQYHCRGDDYDLLRHVVQIVGYDNTTEPPHFIVKNSWGTDYGINGYVKVAIGDFVCGIGRQIGHLEVLVDDTDELRNFQST